MVCLADDPNQAGLNVSCYTKSLDPSWHAAGTEERRKKKNSEVFDIREQEVKMQLIMPKNPATLIIYTADKENITQRRRSSRRLSAIVIYIPYATAESTGLPTKLSLPACRGSWILERIVLTS